MVKIFTYGLSGSGKDTIANYLYVNNQFIKLRIADTIKRIICESKNITFNELEEQKRTNPELRELHHKVSKILDDIAGIKQSSLNRLEQLINGTAFDYDIMKYHYRCNKIIFDVRSKEEMIMLLNAGWVGIFLSRTSNEYKHSGHFTENDAFQDGLIEALVAKYYEQVYVIYNDDDSQTTIKLNDLITKNSYVTDGSEKELLNIVEKILFELYGYVGIKEYEDPINEIEHTPEYYDTERNQAFRF